MAAGPTVALVAVLLAMVSNIPYVAESAVTCKLVVNSLTPCATYLVKGGPVPQNCCNGVKSLYKDAATKADRQMACKCMEKAANLLPGINVANAGDLPGKCDVHIPSYKISPTFDCSTVQ